VIAVEALQIDQLALAAACREYAMARPSTTGGSVDDLANGLIEPG
jgi:hypothetical protein